MGQKLKIWATMTSIILLSGILGFGFSPDAFAGHVDNKGKALGCEKGMAKNNPHCEDVPPPDPLPANVCDTEPDGDIDAVELAAHIPTTVLLAQGVIDAATSVVTNGNDVIDTAPELVELNLLLVGSGFDPC